MSVTAVFESTVTDGTQVYERTAAVRVTLDGGDLPSAAKVALAVLDRAYGDTRAALEAAYPGLPSGATVRTDPSGVGPVTVVVATDGLVCADDVARSVGDLRRVVDPLVGWLDHAARTGKPLGPDVLSTIADRLRHVARIADALTGVEP